MSNDGTTFSMPMADAIGEVLRRHTRSLRDAMPAIAATAANTLWADASRALDAAHARALDRVVAAGEEHARQAAEAARKAIDEWLQNSLTLVPTSESVIDAARPALDTMAAEAREKVDRQIEALRNALAQAVSETKASLDSAVIAAVEAAVGRGLQGIEAGARASIDAKLVTMNTALLVSLQGDIEARVCVAIEAGAQAVERALEDARAKLTTAAAERDSVTQASIQRWMDGSKAEIDIAIAAGSQAQIEAIALAGVEQQRAIAAALDKARNAVADHVADAMTDARAQMDAGIQAALIGFRATLIDTMDPIARSAAENAARAWLDVAMPAILDGSTKAAMAEVAASLAGIPGMVEGSVVAHVERSAEMLRGPRGHLTVARAYAPGIVFDAGALVTHDGSTWQAVRATELEPPADSWQVVMQGVAYRGTWESERAYRTGDIVAWNGCTWMRTTASDEDAAGDEPGKSGAWGLAAKQGKTGRAGTDGRDGVDGAQGPAGERGVGVVEVLSAEGAFVFMLSDGSAHALTLPEMLALRQELALIGASVRALEDMSAADTQTNRPPLLRYCGTWDASDDYVRGEVITFAGALFVALKASSGEIPLRYDGALVGGAWQMMLAPASGGTGGGSASGVPDPLVLGAATITELTVAPGGGFHVNAPAEFLDSNGNGLLTFDPAAGGGFAFDTAAPFSTIAPTDPSHIANKAYVDGLLGSPIIIEQHGDVLHYIRGLETRIAALEKATAVTPVPAPAVVDVSNTKFAGKMVLLAGDAADGGGPALFDHIEHRVKMAWAAGETSADAHPTIDQPVMVQAADKTTLIPLVNSIGNPVTVATARQWLDTGRVLVIALDDSNPAHVVMQIVRLENP